MASVIRVWEVSDDDRLLKVLIQTYESGALLDDSGKWSVRDCLSHVAASSRVSGAGQRGLAGLSGQAQPVRGRQTKVIR